MGSAQMTVDAGYSKLYRTVIRSRAESEPMTETPAERDMGADVRAGRAAKEGSPVVTPSGHRPSGGSAGDPSIGPVVRAVLRLGGALECRLASALTGLSDEALDDVVAALRAGRSPRWALGIAEDEREVRQRLRAMASRDGRVDEAGRRRERARALEEAAETLEEKAVRAGVGTAGAGR